MSSRLPSPDSGVLTELAVGSDGAVYVTARGRDSRRFAGRPVFVGYALHRTEVAELGARGVHAWAAIGRLAWGSDGRVYVHEGELAGTRGRKVFRGFAATELEAAAIVATLHCMAASIVVDARRLLRERTR
jgi:hypothetical protein